ncbi:MAG: tetratricopeptide repeat protein [Caldilineaceae bacterium]
MAVPLRVNLIEGDVSFGNWIRRRRKMLDLTQDALADAVGCSVALIRKIEGDERRPSPQIAELLARVLQIPEGEQEKFIKIARSQLRSERLETIAPIQATLPTPPPPPALDLPWLASPPIRTFNLPLPPTSMLGREGELQGLGRLLAQPNCRLLTVVGQGGMGKTRLALALAQQVTEGAMNKLSFSDGVAFVPLAALTSAEYMVTAIASSLNFTFAGSTEVRRQLINLLREKQMLLVLDNLEHLLDGVDLLSEILEQCAGVKLLATSRERLSLQGEWVFDLQGLPVPPEDDMNLVAETSAVSLFVERAQRVQANFRLDADNQRAILRICRQVEGLPLGIELAAAWVHMLSCTEIAQEIEQNIDFLAVNRRDLPERHRSLRAVFDHSWKLLTEAEQRAMLRLAIFRGGCTREAAAQIADAPLPMLLALVAKSLVQRRENGRYELHELVRQYAAQRLEATAQASETRNRSLVYFTKQMQQASSRLGRADHVATIAQFEAEADNVRAALHWALERQQTEAGMALALAMANFWDANGYWNEGREWLTKFLDAGYSLPLPLRAQALQSAGDLMVSHADLKRAAQFYSESHQLWQTVGDHKGLAAILYRHALVASEESVEERYFQQSLALWRELNEPRDTAYVLLGLGRFASGHLQFDQALRYYEESLALFRSIDDQIGVAHVLRGIGVVAYRRGDYEEAQRVQVESLALYRTLNFKRGIAIALNDLGDVALRLGSYEGARQLYLEDLLLGVEMNSKWDIAWSFEGLAHVAYEQQQDRLATQLFAISQSLFEEIHTHLRPEDQKMRNQIIDTLRKALGSEEFSNIWAEGQSLPLRDAVRLVS